MYFKFLRGEVEVPGKDKCEMGAGALAAATTSEDAKDGGAKDGAFALFNVMLPRCYFPEWQGNVFERRAVDVADQLRGGDMAIDFDQVCDCCFYAVGCVE